MSSSSFNNRSVDHLFLQTLISRLQIRQQQQQPNNNPINPRSLDDILLEAFSNFPSSDDDDADNSDFATHVEDSNDFKTGNSKLAKEESRLEKQLIRLIRSGDTQTLKPNSGQAVSIGEHHICVGNHVEDGSDYRVWEWHGHIMMFDVEDGYTPEYIYGNYFERLPAKHKGKKEKKEVEEPVQQEEEEPVNLNLGLKELIDGAESGGGRVVHRGLNPARADVLLVCDPNILHQGTWREGGKVRELRQDIYLSLKEDAFQCSIWGDSQKREEKQNTAATTFRNGIPERKLPACK